MEPEKETMIKGKTPVWVTDPSDIVVFSEPREEKPEIAPDIERVELKWLSDIEKVINGWKDKCDENSKAHNKKAAYYKKVYKALGIPSAVLPAVLAVLNSSTGEGYKVLISGLMIVLSVISGVAGFINAGKKYEQHYQYEFMYSELSNEITSEMVKPRRNRPAADVFLQKIVDKYNSVNKGAPAL